ncbi:MAG: hypothetical protein AAFX50_15625, partial [Acidobacteriota bacterium]
MEVGLEEVNLGRRVAARDVCTRGTAGRHHSAWWKRAAAAVAVAGLASAAGAVTLTDDALTRLRGAGVDPADVTAPMDLTPEMQAWAEERVQRGAPDEIRLKRLLRELYEADDRNFLYQEGYTATVAETFATGRYNCLSFSMLYVALARSLELEAFYLSIKRDQDFRKVDVRADVELEDRAVDEIRAVAGGDVPGQHHQVAD